MTTAVYAGSFDPITLGHSNLIYRASLAFDKVIVGIGVNSAKKYLFSLEERTALVQQSVTKKNVEVASFEGLLVNFCKSVGATVIIRGLRAVTDFELELGIAHANADQEPGIDTFFLPTQPSFSFVSSTVVRELAKYNGKVNHFVSSEVERALKKKFST